MSQSRILVVALLGAVVALSTQVRGGDPMPDTEVGLNKAAAVDIPTPEPTQTNESEPGELPVPGASFPEGPPPISHGVGDFLPITLERNDCIDCHAVEEKLEGEATPIPPSHYTDLRRAPGIVADALAGARYTCTACHAVPGSNAPLVGNGF